MNKTSFKPVIAVDIDDVLAKFVGTFTDYSNRRWGGDYKVDNYTEDWVSFWEVSYVEAVRRREEMKALEFNVSLPVLDKSYEVLRRLKDGYQLVTVTSRPKDIADLTNRWLKENFPKIFDESYFVGIWDSLPGEHKIIEKQKMHKGQFLRDVVGADYLIDDHAKHTNGAADFGIESLLFGNYGWNRNAEIVNGVTRVADWGG